MIRIGLIVVVLAASLAGLSTMGVAQMSQASSKEHEGRRICRTSQETGKLASRRRVCLTQAEWDRAAEEGRRSGQEWVMAMDACRARGESPGDC